MFYIPDERKFQELSTGFYFMELAPTGADLDLKTRSPNSRFVCAGGGEV